MGNPTFLHTYNLPECKILGYVRKIVGELTLLHSYNPPECKIFGAVRKVFEKSYILTFLHSYVLQKARTPQEGGKTKGAIRETFRGQEGRQRGGKLREQRGAGGNLC